MKTKSQILCLALCVLCGAAAFALDNPGITGKNLAPSRFTLVKGGKPRCAIRVETDETAVKIAASNLAQDFERVTGAKVPEKSDLSIVVRIDPAMGTRETYRITFTEKELVITGSDRRGAVYGIYELSEQIGVSPWYDWADAPLPRHETLAIVRGEYTNGEPAVRYRGLFLNDEAPCLTGWVKNTYGANYGDHRFYARVGELILRLRGNFLWPAMWQWAFYADDPENSKTLDAMGVIVGTSHHEPMGRNHQEWARKRKEYGAWNYATNKATLDTFFAEGVRRLKDTEDIVTIGMRGDGDKAMDGAGNLELMKSIIANQRRIIEEETGKPAAETPQVWALYKEVQDDYDRGLRPPEDVTILLCDDNWGNVRRLPSEAERAWPGGWGMYYHVDYVGAPRNSKFFNCTSAISMWEQMSLAYEYGVDRLWILNVGDLKPMEYPISLFLDMAWHPTKYTPATLHEFTVTFCASLFGKKEAKEAARILDTTSRWACRCTPEMLNKDTFDLASGEWAKVAGDYARLAADARAQYNRLPAEAKDAYFEIVLFHVEVMANLYEMYYAQAMNHALAAGGSQFTATGNTDAINCVPPEGDANYWADRVEAAFARHAQLCNAYNEEAAHGKWNGMMRQKVIGYTSWSDNFPADTCPKVVRVGAAAEAVEAAERAAALLAQKEPRIYSNPRNTSSDKELGENWWMRRHAAILEQIRNEKVCDLVLIGDSITHRWERQGAAAYASVTNELKVLNLGFGADNVKNCLWRLRSGELDGYRAKAVQLLIGTNNNPHEPAEETAAQIRACLREIRAHQPSAKILLCPILPRGTPDCVERGKNDNVNELLKPLADGKTIVWTDYSDLFTLEDGRMNPALADDGLHPNAAGYAEWSKIALPLWRNACGANTEKPEDTETRRIRENESPCLRVLQNLRANAVGEIIDAKDCAKAAAPAGLRWEFLPGLGRGTGAMEVFPRTADPSGARLEYKVALPAGVPEVEVTVVTRSSLAFARPEGHRYIVGFADGAQQTVNFNGNLNENPKNCYSVFYPTVARRVVEKKVRLAVPNGNPTLVLAPLDPGIAFEQIIVSWAPLAPPASNTNN